jgi:hypothetical protein
VSAGPHTVSETAGTGTSLADYSTTINGACAANGTVTLVAGDNKTCTITNQRAGRIVIRKVAVPQDAQDFNFTCATLGTFQLDDDGADGNPLDSSRAFTGVAAGSYDCSENQVSGWMMQIACTDPDNGTTVEPPTAHIDVDGGETVDCTFTNTFVPGPPPVGGIMGLIDGAAGGARSGGSGTSSSGPDRVAAIALIALAFVAFAGLVTAARRRAG